jgi:hypothetical protein
VITVALSPEKVGDGQDTEAEAAVPKTACKIVEAAGPERRNEKAVFFAHAGALFRLSFLSQPCFPMGDEFHLRSRTYKDVIQRLI